jgi:xylan 1,4-beta-xylosidase
VSGPSADIRLLASGIPPETKRVLVRHYRIDQTHSNAYSVWKQMGSPQKPTDEQYRTLEDAGQLQLLASPHWVTVHDGEPELNFSLPLQGISLVELSW